MNILIKGDEVNVPSVIGLKFTQANDICSDKGLNLKEKGKRFDDMVPEGHIIYQEPAANDLIKKRRNVWVYVSKGSRMTSVPDLYSQPMTRANLVISNSGLIMGRIAKTYSDTVPANKIIAQNPAYQQSVKRGTPINLLVSSGYFPSYYLMPDLIGEKINSARRILGRVGIEKIKITYKKNDKMNDGVIISQKPGPDITVNPDTTVEIDVNAKDVSRSQQNLRYVLVSFKVPEDSDNVKRVKIILIDNNGRKEVFNEVKESGTKVETFVGVSGDAEVEIYVNDNIFEEKKL